MEASASAAIRGASVDVVDAAGLRAFSGYTYTLSSSLPAHLSAVSYTCSTISALRRFYFMLLILPALASATDNANICTVF